MGIVFLLRRKHQRNVNLVYSFVMLGVTIAWFVTNTINNEAGIIINLVSPLQTSEDGLYCATANVLDVALASAIYVGSDILLVSEAFIHCAVGSCLRRRSTACMYCSETAGPPRQSHSLHGLRSSASAAYHLLYKLPYD
jgi:hypothetical protein